MRTKISNVLWGLFFILLGVGFAGRAFNIWNFDIFFPGWWTLFIIIPCGISIFQSGARFGSICGLVIGLLLLLSQNSILSPSVIGKLIFPVILIMVGVSIMFKHTFHGFGHKDWESMSKKKGILEYSATFSGQKIQYNNEIFIGATLNAVFGGVELRLENAIINEDVVINCSAIFGGIDIHIPNDLNVKVSSTPIFGGVSNKHKDSSIIQDAPTVYVNATCMFGGVDIQ